MTRLGLLGLILGVLLVAAPFGRVVADEYEYGDEEDVPSTEDDVVVLTAKNFDSIVAKNKFVLAEFYAPWCGHCKSLAPHYAKAASIMKQKDPSVIIAKVDATEEASLAKTQNIKGYPTIKWFVDGQATDYSGPRTSEGIVSWLSKRTGPPAARLDNADMLADIEVENEVVVLGYFKEMKGAEYDAFVDVARRVDDVAFAETSSADVASAAGLSKPGVVAVKNFKGEPRGTAEYPGRMEAAALEVFVNGEKLPLTIEFTMDAASKIFGAGIDKQLFLWAQAGDLVPEAPLYSAFKQAAIKFKGQLVFVTVDFESPNARAITNFFGLKEADPPQIVGLVSMSKKYQLSDELNAESVAAFAQGVVDGTATAQFKSQPPPEKATDEDGVTTIVGKTVEPIVMDSKKDVLLEVYAPWCGHCKKLEPIYKKLAKRFKKIDSVVIAKMDGTENESPVLEVSGFPTLVFVPAEEGAVPIPYEGDRGLTSLTKFIKQHAKIPYELPKKGDGDEGAEHGEGYVQADDEL